MAASDSTYDVQSLFANNLALKGADVPASQLQGKVVGLYFSAHWCPPCRAFTPVLIKAYKAATAAGAAFELIFVSSDEDQEGFDEYTKDMPWPSVKFSEEEARTSLGERFGVQGIPQLIILGKDGKLITREGRAAVAKDKDAAIQAWAA
jgi:nucleoredoxin